MNTLQTIEATVCSTDRLMDIGVPSASIAIQHVSGEVETHVITKGSENTDTIYQCCSISKAITGVAVAKLIDEGKLTYETKVYDYVPATIRKSITPHGMLEHVTIGHILSHRSGLSRSGMPGYAEGVDMPTYEEMFAGVAPSNTERIRFLSFPGAQHSYSGGAFTLLQLVLENILGKPFPQLMTDIVLGPLGMSRSHFGDLPEDEQNYSKAHLTAYTQSEPGRSHHRFLELAAAGLWTTPTDLLKAFNAIQKSLRSDSGFLRKATTEKMLTIADPDCGQKDMALGWFADNYFFAHSGGNWPGYSCYAFAAHGGSFNDSVFASAGNDEEHDYGLAAAVVMTGSESGIPAFRKLTMAIFHEAGWPKFESLPSHFGSMMEEMVPDASYSNNPVRDDWKAWVGKWSKGWEVIDGGSPRVTFRDFVTPVNLIPAAAPSKASELVFVVEGMETALWFTFDDKGDRIIELVQTKKQTLRRV